MGRVVIPSRPILRDGQSSFGGGLNTTADESQLGPDELRRAENARLGEFGAVTRRLGTKRTHAAAIAAFPVRGGFAWKRAATTTEFAVCNGSLYHGTFAIPMTWTLVGAGLDAAVYPQFAAFRDGSGEIVYIADGGLLNKATTAAITLNLAGTPSVSALAVYNQRLFGVSGSDETLYWSALNNGDSLGIAGSGGGSAVVRTFGAQAIKTVHALGSSLLLIHREGISLFTGWADEDIAIDAASRGMSTETGTTAPHSFVPVETSAFMLSANGLFLVTESGVECVSTKIASVIRSLDQTLFSRVRAAHHKARNEVLFYLPDVGVYAYNYAQRAWTGPWTGAYTSKVAHSLWSSVDTAGAPITLWGGNDGFVRQVDAATTYKDDVLSDGTGGSAYTMVAQPRRFFFGDASREKSLRWAFVTTNVRGSARASLTWSADTATGSRTLAAFGGDFGSGTWGSGVWGGGSVVQKLPVHGRGNSVDCTFTDDGEAESVFSRVEMHAHDMGVR